MFEIFYFLFLKRISAHTILHLLNSPATTLSPSITMSPAITALVVAIAGIMLPAMARDHEGDIIMAGQGKGRESITFHVKPALHGDTVIERPQISSCHHKVQRQVIILTSIMYVRVEPQTLGPVIL